MRYLTSQRIVSELIDHLALATRPFPFGSDANLNYLRGARFTVGDLKAYAPNVPYDLTPDERGLTAGGCCCGRSKRLCPGPHR